MPGSADGPPEASGPGLPTAGLPTTGHHVFVGSLDADQLRIEGGEGHHLATVLRVRPGEDVSLADGTGVVAQGTVTRVDRGAVDVAVGRRIDVPPATPRVTVVQGVPKGRKMDEVVQRLSEVGVDRLVPVHTSRTVKHVAADKADKVLDRWRAVALAAARQSRRPRVMQVDPVTDWPVPDIGGVALHERASRPLSAVLDELLPTDEIVLAVGPEGGFAEEEIAASGLVPAALGSTILRTETAGVVGAALLLHHLGRLG